jgi:hypothetical protein
MKIEEGKRVPTTRSGVWWEHWANVGHEVAGPVPTASPSTYVVAIFFDIYLFELLVVLLARVC